MNHAFTGQNFLSVVLKIVEGETPSLPDRYPSKLNAVLSRYVIFLFSRFFSKFGQLLNYYIWFLMFQHVK